MRAYKAILLAAPLASGLKLPNTPAHPSKPQLSTRRAGGFESAIAAGLAAVTIASSAQAAEPWAFSEDGSKIVAYDEGGRDHQVQIFPGADAEIVNELRTHNVQFAVVPPPEANPAVAFLGTAGGLLINFLPLILLIGLNVLASRGGMGGGGGMGGMGG